MDTSKPMRADARRNYERLLVEAKRAFAARGVEASLEDIARQAGVGIGTLYRHFPTREALLETLLRERFDAQAAAGREQLARAEPLVALKTWLAGLSASSADYRGLSEFLAAALDDETSPLYASCHAMQEVASQLVEHAKAAGELRGDVTAQEVLLLLHAVSWAGEHSPGGGGLPRLLDLVFEGLRAS
ncbi:TetR/AcrR family transcriptional regulator [Amycolatopsis sp. H20-H5]|uniref:TetR/AcrR family transcriptional regulator n=1 Tax=Amycolatopsis sp. H20-H5 TaxID=3046309 RepID=UPI002DBF7A7A|nr:helix-turn-helix domain-containing protein [Amycolatopsis sp. H20-H5]MEC3973789.1 helix-turn-helix domain-containing protein [Amycolatopsis sp. H20-H5]